MSVSYVLVISRPGLRASSLLPLGCRSNRPLNLPANRCASMQHFVAIYGRYRP